MKCEKKIALASVIFAFHTFDALAQTLSPNCISIQTGRILSPNRGDGAQTTEVLFTNNCGQSVDITFAQIWNGKLDTIPATWHNVAPGETKTTQLTSKAFRGGTVQLQVISVQVAH
jgi:hypothetical protein